jgi:MFS family permease
MARDSRPSAAAFRRQSSTLHYQTFPNVKPPTSRGRPISSRSSSTPSGNGYDSGDMNGNHEGTPLPVGQLAILAVIALAEQTAFNSISPYLPEMTSTFPEVNEGQIGLYVGLIASAFALAQFTTNFFWGWLSDRIGRKPVILTGTILTACCFLAFGFSRRLWHAILIQVLLGLVNGNQGLVSACLGEVTDRSNQSKAFTYLPVIYGLGAITGPAIGGLLVFKENPFNKGQPNPYPYLLPNVMAAIILLVDAVLIQIFLKESLDGAKELPPLGERVGHLFTWLWQFMSSSYKPTYLRRNDRTSAHDEQTESSDVSAGLLATTSGSDLKKSDFMNRDTILLLTTFLIFQLSNVAYSSLYPIFCESPIPTGRNLSPEEVGLSMALAGIVTIVFQIFFYGNIRDKLGNRVSFRLSHFLFVIAFIIPPFVGYKAKGGFGNGPVWIWVELGASLIFKTVATVGGLTSALLMVSSRV